MNERITHTDTSIDDNTLMMFLLIVAFPMIEIHPMGTDRKGQKWTVVRLSDHYVF